MKKTDTHFYNMPDREDKVLISDLNQNAEMIDRDIEELVVNLATKAPIHSPQFSGEPLAPKPGTTNVYERIITMGVLTDALEVEEL